LQEEFSVFIVYVANTETAEAAVFFAVLANFLIAEELDIFSIRWHGRIFLDDKKRVRKKRAGHYSAASVGAAGGVR
jgi:hypothetical protein